MNVRATEEKRKYIVYILERYMEDIENKAPFIDTIKAVEECLGMLKAYDSYTYSHCISVGVLANAIGLETGLETEELLILITAATLHDIGKIGIEDGILNKKGPLTDYEMELMKGHPSMGKAVLEGLYPLLDARIITAVEGHHERCDGSGYPYGTKYSDKAVNLAEIIAVADVFDALSNDRPYHKACSEYEALEIVLADKGLNHNHARTLSRLLGESREYNAG